MAGGGIKINNITISGGGGADGRTPIFKIEDGELFYSYNDGKLWHRLGNVKGEQGIQGEKGEQGAQGPQGPQGMIGATGAVGNTGIPQILLAYDGEDGHGLHFKIRYSIDKIEDYIDYIGKIGLVVDLYHDDNKVKNGDIVRITDARLVNEAVDIISDYIILGNISAMNLGETVGTAYEGHKGAQNRKMIEENSSKIEENERLTNTLKQVIVQNKLATVKKVEQAYITRETAAGQNIVDEQDTDVLEIKGKTVSCKNLICHMYTDAEKVVENGGVTFTYYKDGHITLNGLCTESAFVLISNKFDVVPNTQYTLSGYQGNQGGDSRLHIDFGGGNSWNDYGDGNTFTTPASILYYSLFFRIESGVAYNTTLYPMLNEGSTALPYQPYFTGLKHAYIDSIKSFGRNLVPPPPYNYPEGTYAGITYKVNSDGSVTANGKASSTSFFILAIGVYLPEGDYYISDGVNMGFPAHMRWGNENCNTSFHSSGETRDIEIRVDAGTVLNNVTFKPMINRGTTALPFEPYTEETYQLPQTLELGGWKDENENWVAFDSFNPQTGELVRGTKTIVFDGTEEWFKGENDSGIYFSTYDRDFVWCTIVNNKFPSHTFDHGTPCAYMGLESIVFFPNADKNNPTITTVEQWTAQLAEWKSAGTPLTVAYKSATPTTETIENAPKTYKAYNHGSETVKQGTTDNSKFGAMVTITNEYFELKEV